MKEMNGKSEKSINFNQNHQKSSKINKNERNKW